jgi:hypothetical protein
MIFIMKQLKYIGSFILVFFMSLTSCDMTDTNVDPTRPVDVALNLILPTAIGQAAYNQMSVPARLAGIVMQHYQGFDAQQVAYTDYVIPDNTFNNYWNFGAYGGVLKDARDIIAKADEQGQPHYKGIALVLKAEALGYLAAAFGDVPESEALLGTANLKPKFDSQSAVYTAVLAMLDEAITELQKPAVPGGPAGDDLIYGGDASGWIKTANAYKARYLMHLGRTAEAQTAINNSFTSASEEPVFQWSVNQVNANPLARFGIERPNTLIIDPGFGNKLIASADPRTDKIIDDTGATQFSFYSGSNTDLVWAQNNSAIPLISLTELKFYEAEISLSLADLQDAVRESMAQMGVASADAETYISAQVTTATLEDVIDQAYVALYGHASSVVWHNYRRTGFPTLTPSANGANGLNPSGVIPRRWIYPIDERNTNADNLNAAIAAQGWSADVLDSPTDIFN